MSESTTNALFSAPGQFDIYTCRDLSIQEDATKARLRQLEDLTRRAEAGPAGGVIGTVAYRSDYLRARGQLQVIRETYARRECDSEAAQNDPRNRRSIQR